MAIAFVQSANNKTSGATSIATSAFGSSTTTGNAIMVGIANGTLGVSVITGVTDSAGNTFTKATTATNGSSSVFDIWYCTNITGGSGVTVTASASASNEMQIYAHEFSGVLKADALDKTVTQSGTSTTLAALAQNITITGEMIFTGALNANGSATYTVGTGYSNMSQQTGTFFSSATESRVTTVNGSTNVSMFSSTSSSYRIAGAVFKPDISGMSRRTSQDAKGTSTTTSVSATYPAATTAGSLLIADIYTITAGATVTGPSGFTLATSQDFSAGAQNVSIWYKIASGSETTISASATASTQMRIHIYEYTGMDSSGTMDGTNGATSGTTSLVTLASGSITTTNANDMLHVALGLGGSTTAHAFDSGFTVVQSDAATIRLASGDQYFTATGTYGTTATWTTSVRAGAAIAAFTASTGGSPPPLTNSTAGSSMLLMRI